MCVLIRCYICGYSFGLNFFSATKLVMETLIKSVVSLDNQLYAMYIQWSIIKLNEFVLLKFRI